MFALVVGLFSSAACLTLAVQSGRARRSSEARGRELEARLADLAGRIEMAEQNTADAVVQSEVTASVLLEKGLADEEDLEAARRRFQPNEAVQPVHGTGNSLH
ncbi:hypothetical protein [Anaeromyxobacter paludicola]|uniref:Uncharacterized protein n=1 Tax=Anaeromyxobacter paludicola TaxID=2918171 RepID=A0ABN6N8D9_9BACT|nr:hypothetical protein [Anaeromyxobacter paludicola]BDG09476.1 hypothetical protein AMPC_25890 [Anaeromyxobacter paludicola]